MKRQALSLLVILSILFLLRPIFPAKEKDTTQLQQTTFSIPWEDTQVIMETPDGYWEAGCYRVMTFHNPWVFWISKEPKFLGLYMATNPGYLAQGLMSFEAPKKPSLVIKVNGEGEPQGDVLRILDAIAEGEGTHYSIEDDFMAEISDFDFKAILKSRNEEYHDIATNYTITCM